MENPETKFNDFCNAASKFLQERKLTEAFGAAENAYKTAIQTVKFAPTEDRAKWIYRAGEALSIAEGINAMLHPNNSASSDAKNNDRSEDAVPNESILAERPRERLADVSGMEEAKDEIRLGVIEPIRNPKKADTYALACGGGLLLYGLPGTGKTFFAKAVAGELGLPFYVIRSSDVFQKMLGDSEKIIQGIFDTARKNPMSVIFIDETNGLLPSRNKNDVHEVSKRVAEIILEETWGFDSESKNPFLLIGATNFPNEIDDAALSRFTTCIEVELPDANTRRFILKRELGKMKIPIADDAYEYLVEHTESFSCRDLVSLATYYRKCSAKEEISEFSKEFCDKYFKDDHVFPANIAQDIENFKKRIGRATGEKKKTVNDRPVSPAPAAPAPKSSPTNGSSPAAGKAGAKRTGEVLFEDIKGLTEAKEIVTRALINPVRYPEIYRELELIPGQGLLLYGPPGTGKTMFARAIANELHTGFLAVSLGDVKGKTSLETTEKIAALFAKARSCDSGCVLFIDDCEEILSRPGSTKAYGVSQFLNELDGLKTHSAGRSGRGHVFVLIATNRPWMIDGALLRSGRLGASVYIGLPDLEARREMFAAALKNVLLADDVDIDKLAERSEGYSGADIYHRFNGGGICNLAREFAGDRWMRRIVKAGPANEAQEKARREPICMADFDQAFAKVVPCSIRDAERIAQNEDFRKRMTPGVGAENAPKPPQAMGFAYPVGEETVISFCTPDAVMLKNYVFGSATIRNTADYKHFADSVYFLYNDCYRDSKTFNAYASVTGTLQKRYGIEDREVTADPDRPAIVLYDGLCMAYTAVAAAYMKYSDHLTKLPEPEALKRILRAIGERLERKDGCFGLSELAHLNARFELFPKDETALKNIQTLASAMIALVIAHELGHIVYGDIFKVGEGGAYSRNMERSADRFAADVLNGMEDPAIREFLFLGGALSFIADAALNNSNEDIPADADISHPNNLERFCNLLKNAPESIKKYNLTESYYLDCIP
jgi:transitional endoplasmic reticulum ATPase